MQKSERRRGKGSGSCDFMSNGLQVLDSWDFISENYERGHICPV
jgi:hypothetical protein